MADNFIVGIITLVEDDSYDGKAFKKVTLGTGQVLKVKYGKEGKLKAKWGLLKEGVAIKFTMRDFTKPDGAKVPVVQDIETVEGALPEIIRPSVETPDQAQIDRDTNKPPAPQELGMWWKELGEMLRAKDVDTTKPMGKALRKAYYAQMFSVLSLKIEE